MLETLTLSLLVFIVMKGIISSSMNLSLLSMYRLDNFIKIGARVCVTSICGQTHLIIVGQVPKKFLLLI